MITHIGTINVDYNILNDRFPEVGETSFGELQIDFAGKGGNQISAASRLGAQTCFISMVGAEDGNIDIVREGLAWSGLSDEHIGTAPGVRCGSAFLMVDKDARNYIVICRAADRFITPEFLETKKEQIQKAKVVMTEFMYRWNRANTA
jgi:ribokinase